MRQFTSKLLAVTMILFTAAIAQAADARLQVIHNAADPAASVVDIYVNGSLYEDDFAFREATEFRTVPAGVQLNIGVAPGNSSSADQAIATIPVTLAAGKTYVAIANGVLDPTAFAANPNAQPIAFNLFARDDIREEARRKSTVDLIAFHGATDAPLVDVRIRGNNFSPLFGNLKYGDFSDYRSVFGRKYTLDITPGNNKHVVVASFEADLNGLAGGAAVVFASGFLNPAGNGNGPAFGLFVALPNGSVAALPGITPTARLQVIHNAADPAAEVVDIYVNDGLYENDFAFREATEFRTVPARVQLNIGVAPGTSTSANDVIATIPVTLEANKTYVAFANGVLDPSAFAANPDARPIGFTLFAKDDIRERAKWFSRVDVIGFHGASDAPAVDIIARGWPFGPIVNDAGYGDFSSYNTLAPKRYLLDVTPGNDNSAIVATFEADLSGLNGGSAVVFASGFLNPATNGNGAAFGLFAALPNGTVVTLPPVTPTARLQVIHNSADPAASVVDIYVNGALYEDNFAFREATEFRTVPAGVQLNIGVAPGNSTTANDAIATIPVTLEDGRTYVAIANGVLNPNGFATNPDGANTGFNLFAVDGIREESGTKLGVSTVIFHGSTDAPTVDIYARVGSGWNWRVVNDASYGNFTDNKFLFAKNYTLTVTPGNSTAVVASFNANLTGLGGGAAVVFASGFLNPGANGNGPAFGIFAALPNGSVVAFPAATPSPMVEIEADEESALAAELNRSTSILPESFELSQNYPNPFNPTTTISFALPKSSQVSLTVFNILGQEVARLVDGTMPAGTHQVNFDASNVSSGIYFYRIQTDEFSEQKKMVLLK